MWTTNFSVLGYWIRNCIKSLEFFNSIYASRRWEFLLWELVTGKSLFSMSSLNGRIPNLTIIKKNRCRSIGKKKMIFLDKNWIKSFSASYVDDDSVEAGSVKALFIDNVFLTSLQWHSGRSWCRRQWIVLRNYKVAFNVTWHFKCVYC